MAEPLFVSQSKLEEWIVDGTVTFDDNILTLLEHDASYTMAPAARVTELLDGKDSAGLLGGVFTIEALEERGAEYFHDSILLGDTAYQCEPGFVGDQHVPSPEPDTEPLSVEPQRVAMPVPAPVVPGALRAPVRPPSKPAEAEPITLTEQLPPPLPPRPKSKRVAPPAASAPSPTAKRPEPAAAQEKKPESELDLLTDFMLKNL